MNTVKQDRKSLHSWLAVHKLNIQLSYNPNHAFYVVEVSWQKNSIRMIGSTVEMAMQGVLDTVAYREGLER